MGSWTEEQKGILRKAYECEPVDTFKLCKELGKGRKSICYMAKLLGLKRKNIKTVLSLEKYNLTQDQLDFMRENATKLSVSEIATKIGLTPQASGRIINQMGFERFPRWKVFKRKHEKIMTEPKSMKESERQSTDNAYERIKASMERIGWI